MPALPIQSPDQRAALEGGFLLSRAARSTEPMLAAGEMAAALVA
jgi:hypothetical protein